MLGFIIKILPIISLLGGLLCGGVVYEPEQQVSFLVGTASGTAAPWILSIISMVGGFIVQSFFPEHLDLWNKLKGFLSSSDSDLSSVLKHLTAVQTYGVKVGCDKLVKGACDLSEHCSGLAIKAKADEAKGAK